MSSLHPSDAALHHEDGSHRWAGGGGTAHGDAAWLARIREHLEQHRAAPRQGGPVRRSPRDAVVRRPLSQRRRRDPGHGSR